MAAYNQTDGKTVAPAPRAAEASRRPPFQCIALLLQGGGALGAYQAGVYEALHQAGLEPDWVAGISIGAINAAIIAGNRHEDRVAKLREFWDFVTTDAFQFTPSALKNLMTRSDGQQRMLSSMSAIGTLMNGVPGFFKPRVPNPWLEPQGMLAATSFYDTSSFKETLEKVIDFERINTQEVRFNVGAVHITSGDFVNFDNKIHKIGPQHIMASGALPPGLPPVEVDGEYYWDGGLISNTPLQWVVEDQNYMDTLVFQVDLWSADGEFPQNIADVLTRQKDIQYSSRTRANTDRFREEHKMRHNNAKLLKKIPESMKDWPEIKMLAQNADSNVYNIVHLIYHNKSYEGYSKDFEFSRLNMEAHWQSGYDDTVRTLKNPQVLERPHNREGVAIFDFCKSERMAEEKTQPKAS